METFSTDTLSSPLPARNGAWLPLSRPSALLARAPFVRSWHTACDSSDPPFIAPCSEPDCAHISFARNHAPQGGHTPLLYADSDPVYLSPPPSSSPSKSTIPLPDDEGGVFAPRYSTHLAGVLDSPPVMRRRDLASQKPLTPPPTMPHTTLSLPDADVDADSDCQDDDQDVEDVEEEYDSDESYTDSSPSPSPHSVRFDLPLSPLSPSWDPSCARALSIASHQDFLESEHLDALFSTCDDGTAPPTLDCCHRSPISSLHKPGSLLGVDVDIDAPRPLLAPISIPWASSQQPAESDPGSPSTLTSSPPSTSLIDCDNLSPPSSPLISRLDLPDLEDDGLPKIIPSSPSRRSFSRLPDADAELSPSTSEQAATTACSSQQLLSLPGAETDDDLIPRIAPPSRLCPWTPSEPLLFIDDPRDVPLPRSPSPEDFDLRLSLEDITDPELAKLYDLRKRSIAAERAARRVEALTEDVDLFTRAEARKIRKRERERSKEVGTLIRLKLGDRVDEVVCTQDQAEQSLDELDPQNSNSNNHMRRRGVIGSMSQLVAQMVFRRHEMARPLAKRRTANATHEYVRSALSDGVSADD